MEFKSENDIKKWLCKNADYFLNHTNHYFFFDISFLPKDAEELIQKMTLLENESDYLNYHCSKLNDFVYIDKLVDTLYCGIHTQELVDEFKIKNYSFETTLLYKFQLKAISTEEIFKSFKDLMTLLDSKL